MGSQTNRINYLDMLARAEPLIAAGVAVGFWYFFPTEKGLGPRGY